MSRYFGGDVDISTVSAHSVEWYENAGHLSKQSIDETAIAPEDRIPRVTAATWYAEVAPVFRRLTKRSHIFQEVREWCSW